MNHKEVLTSLPQRGHLETRVGGHIIFFILAFHFSQHLMYVAQNNINPTQKFQILCGSNKWPNHNQKSSSSAESFWLSVMAKMNFVFWLSIKFCALVKHPLMIIMAFLVWKKKLQQNEVLLQAIFDFLLWPHCILFVVKSFINICSAHKVVHLTYPSGPWVPPISQCTIDHA